MSCSLPQAKHLNLIIDLWSSSCPAINTKTFCELCWVNYFAHSRLILLFTRSWSMFLGGGGLTDPRPCQTRVTLCIKHGHIMWRGLAVPLHYLKLYQVMSRWMNPFIRAANSHYSAVIKCEGSGWEVPRLTGGTQWDLEPLNLPSGTLNPISGSSGMLQLTAHSPVTNLSVGLWSGSWPKGTHLASWWLHSSSSRSSSRTRTLLPISLVALDLQLHKTFLHLQKW